MAKVFILTGGLLLLIGLLLQFAPGILTWFGRLPGDIRVQNGNSFFFFPLTSMIVISIVLSVGFYLLSLFK